GNAIRVIQNGGIRAWKDEPVGGRVVQLRRGHGPAHKTWGKKERQGRSPGRRPPESVGIGENQVGAKTIKHHSVRLLVVAAEGRAIIATAGTELNPSRSSTESICVGEYPNVV